MTMPMHVRATQTLRGIISRLEERREQIRQTIDILRQELGSDERDALVGSSVVEPHAQEMIGRPGRIVDAYFAAYPDHHVAAADVTAWAEAAGYAVSYDPIYNAMMTKSKSGKLARDAQKKFCLPSATG